MDTSLKIKDVLFSSFVSGGITFLFYGYCTMPTESQLYEIAKVLAGVSGTLLGFLITAITLLTAVMDRQLVANMRRTGHYQRLLKETFYTCAFLLILLVNSIFMLFIKGDFLNYSAYGLVFFSIFSLWHVIKAGYRFCNIFIVMS